MEKEKELVIIGSGPAGLTAGIYAGRANLSPLVIEGPDPGGQLMSTTVVENWPGEISVMGPKLMMTIKEQAKKCGAEFLARTVTRVAFDTRPFTLWTHKEEEIKAKAVLIATGATPKRLHVPGEDTYWGKGVTTCAVCDGAFFKNKKVFVIGGGDTAMEDASFLKKFTNDITVVQILDQLTASPPMQKRVLDDPDITIRYNATVTEFKGDGERLKSMVITDQLTNKSETVDADGVFLAVGLNPNTDLFKGQLDLDEWGYLKVFDHTKTSVEGVFAAGDVHDFRYRQAITAAGSGCKAALDVERWLSSLHY